MFALEWEWRLSGAKSKCFRRLKPTHCKESETIYLCRVNCLKKAFASKLENWHILSEFLYPWWLLGRSFWNQVCHQQKIVSQTVGLKWRMPHPHQVLFFSNDFRIVLSISSFTLVVFCLRCWSVPASLRLCSMLTLYPFAVPHFPFPPLPVSQ